MEHFGPVVTPDDVGGGQAALAAVVAILVLMIAVIPALYFTWHIGTPVREPEPED